MNDNERKNSETYTTKEAAMLLRERSPAAMNVDNLMRKVLRVSDPANSLEVAEALGKTYQMEKEVMSREALGLPYRLVPTFQVKAMDMTTTHIEMEQAKKDVERDLTFLVNHSILKKIEPELRGWASVIRDAIAEGYNTARFGLDPRQRDRAFAIRRLLGDYARISRYVGALTPTMNLPYRRLAQSLDEVAGVLLVLVGDAIANVGYGGGGSLLQTPVSELQERRDAVIYALRNLVGSTQEAYGSNEWPRGLEAYRQFIKRLEDSGHLDLKTLFQENNIARIMDELIVMATNAGTEGIRSLGSTALLSLGRFRRLRIIGQRLVDPASPPLATFLSAIRLFIDAFEKTRSGYRIIYISRPSIVLYGLYGIGGPDAGTLRLIELIQKRGEFAEKLDCFLGCECDPEDVKCQIILDKILYDLDRAIDLYTLSTDSEGNSEPEQRAVAYGDLIQAVLDTAKGVSAPPWSLKLNEPLKVLLDDIRNKLQIPDKNVEHIHQELCMQLKAEEHWKDLLPIMAPSCISIDDISKTITDLIKAAGGTECEEIEPRIPPHHETSLDALAFLGNSEGGHE